MLIVHAKLTTKEVKTMSKFSMRAPTTGRQIGPLLRCGFLYGGALASALFLVGCAVEWQNRQAAQEMAEHAKPPGSVYVGWRVFQDRCASCHGASANGSYNAPDLLPTVAAMGPRQFVSRVLQRYSWNLSSTGANTVQDTLVNDIMQRREAPLIMPAWQGEPRVSAHIADLYAYLSARAAGTQGPDRPTP